MAVGVWCPFTLVRWIDSTWTYRVQFCPVPPTGPWIREVTTSEPHMLDPSCEGGCIDPVPVIEGWAAKPGQQPQDDGGKASKRDVEIYGLSLSRNGLVDYLPNWNGKKGDSNKKDGKVFMADHTTVVADDFEAFFADIQHNRRNVRCFVINFGSPVQYTTRIAYEIKATTMAPVLGKDPVLIAPGTILRVTIKEQPFSVFLKK